MKQLLLPILLCMAFTMEVVCQPETNQSGSQIVFLKSLAVSGLGHHYRYNNNGKRGPYHVGADIALVLGFWGKINHVQKKAFKSKQFIFLITLLIYQRSGG